MINRNKRARDVVTGTWKSTVKKRRGLDMITTCLNLRGYDEICESSRVSSILGDIKNLRITKRGHTKADLYDGKNQIADMTIIKGYEEFSEDLTFLDGTLRLDGDKDTGIFFDDDYKRGWVYRAEYFIDI